MYEVCNIYGETIDQFSFPRVKHYRVNIPYMVLCYNCYLENVLTCNLNKKSCIGKQSYENLQFIVDLAFNTQPNQKTSLCISSSLFNR